MGVHRTRIPAPPIAIVNQQTEGGGVESPREISEVPVRIAYYLTLLETTIREDETNDSSRFPVSKEPLGSLDIRQIGSKERSNFFRDQLDSSISETTCLNNSKVCALIPRALSHREYFI